MFDDPVAAAVARHLAFAPAASMAELAEAAGVSRATLFRRFPSRNAAVAELCEAATRAYIRAVDAAAVDRGSAGDALTRLLSNIADIADTVGLLGLQPLEEHVEQSLLTQAADTENAIRALVRRGQEDGEFNVAIDPEWVLAMLTWLTVAIADSIRLGRLTPTAARRHLINSITATLCR
ncbi:Transcriptional regulator, TetR family protein [Gordonia terrae C-6]|uniref:Transcriptional regulator, TetR family protein n=1 Tax=Gordonia terrae C-6 TaxID=1316928 RepID=R7Y8L4_9ACTN|nr:Transcriptional regulator, TetR family protein [Gordonia terrae C-6]